METTHVVMDRAEARDLYRQYRQHLHHSTPIDRECMRAYQLLAQGRLVIKALESVVKAGLDAQNLPKLAIATATATACECRVWSNGSVRFDSRQLRTWRRSHDNEHKLVAERAFFQFPRGTFKPREQVWGASALVPGVPVADRPKRGLANYHILWEAEWSKVVPRDPFLLRRIGKADLWLVVAMWELTEVERGALATRL
jgi:hypothetical protein